MSCLVDYLLRGARSLKHCQLEVLPGRQESFGGVLATYAAVPAASHAAQASLVPREALQQLTPLMQTLS